MITELTEFMDLIQREHPLTDFRKTVPDGLHIGVQAIDGQVQVQKVILCREKKMALSPQEEEYLLKEVLPREMNTSYIESNKKISDFKIHSASPYALKLKKSSLEDSNWMESWKEHLEKYFEKVLEKTETDHTEEEKNIQKCFIKWCQQQLPQWLAEQEEYTKLKSGEYIIVYLLNFSAEEYQHVHENYLLDNLFNTSDYNEEVGDKVYGLSNFFNGDNSKKPYLQHRTAPFGINGRISKNAALKLYLFDLYRRAGAFKTNPLPVFIDQKQLNNEVVNTLKQEGTNISFHALLKKLHANANGDLGNYYLIYILRGEIRDVDFVSAFQYKVQGADIQHLFSKQEGTRKIKSIFDFEHEVVQVIFNNQVVQRLGDNKGFRYRYFDEVEYNPKYLTATTWHLLMEYRTAFYDYIYKSRRQAVTSTMFHDIMKKGILDDLRHDEVKNDQHSKTSDIYRKLNIWFSLWNFFDNDINTTEMTKNLERHRTQMTALIAGEEVVIEDEFYGFIVGQVLWYLFNKSKSSDTSYANLELVLQKQRLADLKFAVLKLFDAYKHDKYWSGNFNKPFSIIQHESPTKLDVKDLLPYILGGFFSNNMIRKTKTENNKNQNDE